MKEKQIRTYNIDADKLERQIDTVIKEGKWNPKAVVAVDFIGNPADYAKIRKISDKYGLLIMDELLRFIR